MQNVDLSVFGIGASADAEVLAKGRRRTITYLSFLVFVLLASALDTIDWVKGGLERVPGAGRRLSASDELLPLQELPGAAGARRLQGRGPQNLYFRVGLTQVATDQTRWSNALGDYLYLTTYEDRKEYFRWANAMAVSPTCANANTSAYNWFCGIQPLSNSAADATFGLLIVSSILVGAAWLGMCAVQNGIPQVVGFKWTYLIVGGLSAATSLFTFIGVVTFSSSNIKSEFCSVLDPDAQWNSQPCGFGDGFGCAGAALAFSLLQTLLYFAWMPKTAAGAKYEFTTAAAGGAVGLSSSAYEGIGATGDAAEPVKAAGGYQNL